jgi:uncharacterized protein (TIGR00255 family)
MTGFGRGEYLDSRYRWVVEIKAVNHRYNEIVVRMPKNLGSLEDKIRRRVANTLQRGRIDVFITVDEYVRNKRAVRVDKELAIAYHSALRELADLFAADACENIYHLSNFPDVIKVEEVPEDDLLLWPMLEQAMDAALANLMHMRMAEGENIQRDLLSRVKTINGYIDEIAERAPGVLSEYRERALTRMKDLLGAIHTEPDEARMLQEAAIFADRISVTEELVRLTSHLSQVETTLNKNEAVGRKLDFLVQEINRETNTIAAKANDYTIAKIVIEIKSEIEKIREQIQNIE